MMIEREELKTRLSLKCSAWKGFMSVQNFSFLARLEVAEKFVVGGGGGVVVGWGGGGGPGQV